MKDLTSLILASICILCSDGFAANLPANAAQGRMVRTERFKYCVYDHGQHRESLVDLQTDPGEIRNLAGDPKYRKILLEHRALL